MKALHQAQSTATSTGTTTASTSRSANNAQQDLNIAAALAKQLAEDEKLALSLLAERLEQEQEQLRIQMENDAVIARQLAEAEDMQAAGAGDNAGHARGEGLALWLTRHPQLKI